MSSTKKCHGCNQVFRREELIDYASPGPKTMYSYCPKCLEEKHAREAFSIKVCTIFGLKSPGPRIWTERKRLYDKYGYTDNVIIDCLEYIYYVEKKKKLVESLCLVTPYMVDKMMKYKNKQAAQAASLVRAMNTEMTEYVVPIRENVSKKKESWNPEDWLED